jgi:CheY-like chemotaxis protein
VHLIIVPQRNLGLVKADPGQIEQVILNLAVNARDAMPRGGKLTIETKNCEIDDDYLRWHSDARLGPHVMIAVSDTGTGMDKETLHHLFEPFFTTKEQGFGTGLGMSTVYGLIKQHRGFVEVSSEVGKGTTVKVYFRPAGSPAAPYTTPSQTAEPEGGNEAVLVVEDEAAIRRAAKRVLEQSGYRVTTVADGEMALETLETRGKEVDLVISDVVMPKMSGTELHQAMQNMGLNKKFILMSGYSARDVRANIRLDTDVPFLQKPWTPNELLTLVRDVLDDAI